MIDLVSAVALLLWGLRLIKTGVSRAFGPRLQRWIRMGTRNRVTAFCCGTVATVALQSSTATAMMTASFVGSGYVMPMMAQAIMLGANVGTSLVSKILALDLHALGPFLLATGVFSFGFCYSKPAKGIARVILGLGLTLLSLRLLEQAVQPMQHSAVFLALMASLDAAPALAVVISAVLALAVSSSLAIVLLASSLAASGTVTPGLGIALVLGANLGGAFPPVLATLRASAASRRVTTGNMIVRCAGCLVLLPGVDTIAEMVSDIDGDRAALIIDSHLMFNLLLATTMLPILKPFAALMNRIIPEPQKSDGGPVHLDPKCLDTPALALAGAARETLRIGDRIGAMLETGVAALRKNDATRVSAIAAMDDDVDRLNTAVKLYLAKLDRSILDVQHEQRLNEIVSYATNLEHIGDIIDRNLRDLVGKKIRNQLRFSLQGAAEIETLFQATIENLRLAQSILVTRDAQLARQLVEAKFDIRRLEEQSAASHMTRFREGVVESIQTSSLHLDMLRDLKRINAHIAAIAYPVLKDSGVLRDTRLIESGKIEFAHTIRNAL